MSYIVLSTACPLPLIEGDRTKESVVMVLGNRVPVAIAGGRLRQVFS